MNTIETLKQLEEFVHNKIPESLHLDYKASPALSKNKKDEICKDISSFANSDGGIVVYGVEEKNNLPEKLDKGVDTTKINREWLDQIITTHITPPIDGIKIIEIQNELNHSYFIINIPKSFRGPHQAPDKKYYKRYNFRSSPMEHYEIEDARNRSNYLPQLVNIDISTIDQLIKIIIENSGSQAAYDVKFKFRFKDKFEWYRKELPPAFKNGIKFFPPGRKISFLIGSVFEILKENSPYPSSFDISVSYYHPQVGNRISEDIHINFNDYLNSTVESNYLEKISNNLKVLNEINKTLSSLLKGIDQLNNISGPTGLNLSITTLKNLKHILGKNEKFEPIIIRNKSINAIKEVLDVDHDMAIKLYHFFNNYSKEQTLEEVEGMTKELAAQITENIKEI